MKNYRIALAQINPVVGDLKNNYTKIVNYIKKFNKKTDLIVFPELCLAGYPPEDLILRDSFLNEISSYLDKIKQICEHLDLAIILGAPLKEKKQVRNAGVYIYKKKIKIVFKNNLPNYGVFDEKRVFASGKKYDCINYRGLKIGLLICEDMWTKKLPIHLMKSGVDIFISINASPYDCEKDLNRKNAAKIITKVTNTPLLYVNQVGGQDELVFDGGSFFINPEGKIINQLVYWQEQIKIIDIFDRSNYVKQNKKKDLDLVTSSEANTWNALVIGLRDYVEKNAFKKVILGLSGGIDSALSAAIAVDALGSDRVIGLLMPSKYSSKDSIKDAKESASLLNIETKTIKINKIQDIYLNTLLKQFNGDVKNITEENLQSRIRGVLLMAYSNNFSYLLLSTGNKSEMSVGYSTIYGDMNGGFNALKDIYKTQVYILSKWRNTQIKLNLKGPKGKVIPDNSIKKEPSAELKFNQKDSDSLPPYLVLDKILYLFIEKELSIDEIIKKGFKKKLVIKIRNLLLKSEYKRRQAPPGVKLSLKSFGKERRYPITNLFSN